MFSVLAKFFMVVRDRYFASLESWQGFAMYDCMDLFSWSGGWSLGGEHTFYPVAMAGLVCFICLPAFIAWELVMGAGGVLNQKLGLGDEKVSPTLLVSLFLANLGFLGKEVLFLSGCGFGLYLFLLGVEVGLPTFKKGSRMFLDACHWWAHGDTAYPEGFYVDILNDWLKEEEYRLFYEHDFFGKEVPMSEVNKELLVYESSDGVRYNLPPWEKYEFFRHTSDCSLFYDTFKNGWEKLLIEGVYDSRWNSAIRIMTSEDYYALEKVYNKGALSLEGVGFFIKWWLGVWEHKYGHGEVGLAKAMSDLRFKSWESGNVVLCQSRTTCPRPGSLEGSDPSEWMGWSDKRLVILNHTLTDHTTVVHKKVFSSSVYHGLDSMLTMNPGKLAHTSNYLNDLVAAIEASLSDEGGSSRVSPGTGVYLFGVGVTLVSIGCLLAVGSLIMKASSVT